MKLTYNTIETERLILEKAVESDIAEIMRLENAPENNKYIWQGTYEQHLNEINDNEILLLMIKEKATLEVVGFVINAYDFHSDRFEFRRIAIDKKGIGYGREVLIALIIYAFENTKCNRFWLDAYPDNERGNRLYRSLGLTFEGTLRQNYLSDRGYLDQNVYSLLREEYDEWKKQIRK